MANATDKILRVDQLEVGFAGKALLPPINFQVSPGELWGVIGPNGAGKTTLLRTLLGLQPAVAGKVSWLGRRAVGYVPQRTSLDMAVPSRVVDVVRGGTTRGYGFLNPFGGFLKGAAINRALRDGEVVNLARQQFPSLSEGQKQRALMARALVCDPGVLLLDEPTSSMDVTAEHNIFQLLQRLAAERNLAVLLVSHHLAVIGSYATHLLLADRDAGLVVAGAAADVATEERLTEILGGAVRDEVARRVAAEELPGPTKSEPDREPVVPAQSEVQP